MVRYGRGRVRLLRKHPETFTPGGFVPALLLAGIAAGPAVWWSPLLRWAWLGGLAAYALPVLLVSVVLCARKRETALLPLLPAVFVAIHFGAAAGQWWELLRGRGVRRAD
jgi:hypothetical protein